MTDKYWAMYEKLKFNYYYYWHYRSRSILINRLLMVFLLSASLAGVAGLWFWSKIPVVWSIIAATAQILSAVAFLLPQSDQISAVNVFLPEIDLLLLKIDRDWALLDDMDDNCINDLVYKYEEEYLTLHNKFIGNTPFPRRNGCARKADKDCKAFKFQRFKITESEVLMEIRR